MLAYDNPTRDQLVRSVKEAAERVKKFVPFSWVIKDVDWILRVIADAENNGWKGLTDEEAKTWLQQQDRRLYAYESM